MYECPNCASNLKFSIARQMLFCEHCETMVDPYSFLKEEDAQESVVSATAGEDLSEGVKEEEYEVTIFTCPQCGGEILSEDTTAATFCSFCGAATILDSRISKERRPSHIIPFTKTKEECGEAYAKMMRRAIFAPDELKDKENIEKFRGIYMPYWVYGFAKKGPVSFTGSKSYRRGDYRYTDYYNLNCEIDEKYKGLAFDAAAAFSDNLSSAISFFDFTKVKKFAPGFLSGFYADTGDVSKDVYQKDAEDIVVEDGYNRITKGSVGKKYNLNEERNITSVKNAVRPSRCKAEFALLPVWFLSYRKGERVCYAVVNGQTGKAVADLPIEPKKYLLGSALLAIPLFILLNLFLTITPTKILLIAAILALICVIISNVQLSDIFARESGEDDKGLMWSRKHAQTINRSKQEQEQDLAEAMAQGREKSAGKKVIQNNFGTGLLKGFKSVLIRMIGIWVSSFVLVGLIMAATAFGNERTAVSIVIAYMVIVFFAVFMIPVRNMLMTARRRKGKEIKKPFFSDFKKKLPTLAKPMAGIVCALLILILNPVSDEFYYIGAFLCMGSVLWAIMDIMKQHNVLTTRKLPQFNRRGGDENA